jgi:hypothetical protein
MITLHSYESLAHLDSNRWVLEAFSGTSIVQWYGNIERQLTRMLEENEAARNFVYADKIRTFLKTWRENEITGSLNRDSIEILKSATEQLAVDPWNLGNYFSNLRDQLRKLLASEEQLPRVATEPSEKMGGPGGGAGLGSMPPLTPEFGAEKEAPVAGQAGAGGITPEEIAGAAGAAGGKEGAPGEEGEPNAGEGAEGGPPGEKRKMPPPPRARGV